MSTLKEFIANVKTNGIAKTNLFEVEFSLPVALQKAGLYAHMRQVLLFCDAAQLPGFVYSTTQIRTFGELMETPYERLFDNVQLSFFVDTNMKVKSLFDAWFFKIQDPTTRTFNYYENYITDIKIKVYDRANAKRYVVTLHECYPKIVSSVGLDYASTEVMKLQVSINYKYWTTEEYASSEESAYKNFLSVSSFTDSLPIPAGYFDAFTEFQGAYNTFRESYEFGTLSGYAGDIIDKSGIAQDVTNAVNDVIAVNVPKFGDNLNFDFSV